ncbi:MAG TPA: hypothetical protein VEY07_06385 [Thermoplasmata archaeon]|nr:hypothetical protein [Thermoplasmata archaeon]
MPASRKSTRSKRPSGSRPRPVTPSAPPIGTLRPVALRDAAEDLGDMFEEGLQHLLATGDPSDWTVGPVRALPLAEMEPGSLGWAAAVVSLDSADPDPNPRPVGELLLVVLPRVTAKTGRPAHPPLRDTKWRDFTSYELHEGTPRLLILARTAEPSAAPALESWMRRLLSHLVADFD